MNKKWLEKMLNEKSKELADWQKAHQSEMNKLKSIEVKILQIQGIILFIRGELDKLDKKRRG